MIRGTNVKIQLRDVKQPPYSVIGEYEGTSQLHERGQVYVIVKGTIGESMDKLIHVPENLIHEIVV